jgi:archaellum component FlaC
VKARPKKKSGGKPSTSDNGPKGLLYGIDAKGHENEAELQELADTDRIIDSELEKVASQIGGLLDMSRTMRSELKTQNAAMDEVEATVAKADYKTKVVNERGRRFLTGKPRQELDKSRTLQLPF